MYWSWPNWSHLPGGFPWPHPFHLCGPIHWPNDCAIAKHHRTHHVWAGEGTSGSVYQKQGQVYFKVHVVKWISVTFIWTPDSTASTIFVSMQQWPHPPLCPHVCIIMLFLVSNEFVLAHLSWRFGALSAQHVVFSVKATPRSHCVMETSISATSSGLKMKW